MKNPFYTALAWVLRRVMKKPRVFGLENITQDEPSVFVSNHEGFFAPVKLMLFANQEFRPWVVYENFDRKLCREYIKKDFVEPTLKLKAPLSGMVSAIISPICVGLMHYVDAIPVYHQSREILVTISQSISNLEQGRNLLIFPEDPKDKIPKYFRNFQPGFIQLAKLLHEKNQHVLRFYPIFVNRHNNQIRFGESVVFDPNNPFPKERDRIIRTLRRRMISMMKESEGTADDRGQRD